MSLYPKELRRTFLLTESCGSVAKLDVLNRAQAQVDLSSWEMLSLEHHQPQFLGLMITDGENKPPDTCCVLQSSLISVRGCRREFIAPRGIFVLHDASCAWCEMAGMGCSLAHGQPRAVLGLFLRATAATATRISFLQEITNWDGLIDVLFSSGCLLNSPFPPCIHSPWNSCLSRFPGT